MDPAGGIEVGVGGAIGVGIERAGGDDVGADLAISIFDGDGFDEGDKAGLGGGVGSDVGSGINGGGAADGEEGSSLGGAHDGDDGAGQVDGGAEVDGEHFVPDVVAGFFDPEAAGEATDQMNDSVDAAASEHDVIDQVLDGGEVFKRDGDVGEGGVVGAFGASSGRATSMSFRGDLTG